MIDVKKVIDLQTDAVVCWHTHEFENSLSGIEALILQQHHFNYLLWHQEDIARSPVAGDSEIASVKRKIDQYNQQRNDWIEKIDDEIATLVSSAGLEPSSDVPMNTETPGSTIDRLSILSLRIYHLKIQLDRNDVSQAHFESVRHKVSVCLLQQDDLGVALQQLLDDIFSGRKRHQTYRQFKMYNDPALNPYLYQTSAG